MTRLKNEHGFVMMSVVFLTLVVSFAAIIFLNVATRVKNSYAGLKLTALSLADEQFAELESLAAAGKLTTGKKNFLGVPEDLITYNGHENFSVEFDTETDVEIDSARENFFVVTVKVKWNFREKNYEIESKKILARAD